MLSHTNTGEYRAMFIRYNPFDNYWRDYYRMALFSNDEENHIPDQFDDDEMVILIQKIDDNPEKKTFILNINAAHQADKREGENLGLYFGEDPYLHEWLDRNANSSFINPNEPSKHDTIEHLNMADLITNLEN